MTRVSQSLRHVKEHLSELAEAGEIRGICRACGYRWRERDLGPATTVHLFLLQLLANVALTALRHVAELSVSAAAICEAKMRLPLQVLMELLRRSVPQSAQSLWRGHEVYLADGTHFKTPDTPALSRRHGKGGNQRGTSCGYPAPKLLALMDLAGGYIRRVICLPAARQEQTCLSRLFKAVGRNGLLLGDRGLVSFAHMVLLLKAGAAGCFRLPRCQVVWGRGKGSRRLIKRQGRQDLLVRWIAHRRPKWLSVRRWRNIAGVELILRQISFRVCRRGFRTSWAWIVTTLLDPRQYPAEELIELYSKRWQIEVYFRDLKRTLGMSMVRARTVEGVRKEMLAFVLLYNLVRRVMEQAARQQNTSADRISFIDALRWLLWARPGAAIPRLIVNPRRWRRSPERKVKEARHRFGQLHQTRAQSSKPPYQVML
jgi:hypothetical protein